jgi:hypothetical protein
MGDRHERSYLAAAHASMPSTDQYPRISGES